MTVLLVLLLSGGVAWADPFLDDVVDVHLGSGSGFGTEAMVLGPPRGAGPFQGALDVLSLGLGGSIVVAFDDNVVVDGPGPDLTVFENAFLQRGELTLPPFSEWGRVSVSADGEHWLTFPCATTAAPYHPGCAGVYPVFANADEPTAPSPLVPSTAPIESLVGLPVVGFVAPAGSGGDVFDLADLGIAAVRFVRIEGVDVCPGAPGLCIAGKAGFDLDAMAGLHSVETQGQADSDGDGIVDPADGCPALADPIQLDGDADGAGDACDGVFGNDADGDGIDNNLDNCVFVPNDLQEDADGDGIGDACDGSDALDFDEDGVANGYDNCPFDFNDLQEDADGDGLGDACDGHDDLDADADGVPDADDNCPFDANDLQEDSDGDGLGDACDPSDGNDLDGDGVVNADDNCPFDPNEGQEDSDGDGLGDVCDDADGNDLDGDGVANADDNCPFVSNADQVDLDGDGLGAACDPKDEPDGGCGGGGAQLGGRGGAAGRAALALAFVIAMARSGRARRPAPTA